MKHLIEIQNELKAPKGRYNSFGKYNYRSCEDILEAVKPVCKNHGCLLVLSDEAVQVGDRYYIKATATLKTPDNDFVVTAFAREEENKKGMDSSQITGTASSYARKYALNGLFNIDDTKDADTDEFHKQQQHTEKKAKKANTTITRKDLEDMIVDLCDEKRFRVSELCDKSGVHKLEDMTDEQLSKWIDWLETK